MESSENQTLQIAVEDEPAELEEPGVFAAEEIKSTRRRKVTNYLLNQSPLSCQIWSTKTSF